MTEEETKALDYGERLLNVAIDVVGTARIEPQSARDPKVIALTLLCRSISNFRAAMLLAQQAHVLESRVLNRCLYENLLWIGALRERGSEFVRELIDDDAHNRQALAQITLKLSSLHGRDVDDEDGMFLRNIIKQIAERFPNSKKLHADKAAAQSSVHSAYIEYLRLSLDSVHCSVTALGRHLTKRNFPEDKRVEIQANVEPKIQSTETMSTILHSCRALMGVAVGANELVGFTSMSGKIGEMVAEFEKNEWPKRV